MQLGSLRGLLGGPTLRVLFEHFAVDHLVVDHAEFVVRSIKDRAWLKLASISHGHSVAGGIAVPCPDTRMLKLRRFYVI